MDLKKLFRARFLLAGQRYWEDGAVSDLCFDGHRITALVQGIAQHSKQTLPARSQCGEFFHKMRGRIGMQRGFSRHRETGISEQRCNQLHEAP